MIPDRTKDIYLDPEQAKIQAALAADLPTDKQEEKQVSTPKFPFTLDELAFWVIKRRDGVFVKYVLTDNAADVGQPVKKSYFPVQPSAGTGYYSSLGDWCHHDPTALPVFSAPGIDLFIADAPGCRSHWTEFDYVIDAGDVLTLYAATKRTLMGDPELVKVLAPHALDQPSDPAATTKTKVLKVDWYDRKAPKLAVTFWDELLKAVRAPADSPNTRLLCVCQGGHGRSGTSLVALMMCLTDYSPLDAITHLRAIHCPRAIESKEQHAYLNELAIYLNREPNALDAESVKSFKDRFLSLTSETSRPYRERLAG